MTSANALRITPRLIFGLGILLIGLLWTLDNFDVLESEGVLRWWPVILIAVGAARFLDPMASKAGSAIFIVLGTLLLLDVADYIDFDFGDLFPLAVAVIGGKLVWDALSRRTTRTGIGDDPSSTVTAFAFMAGVTRQSSAAAFRGGDASAIMGGVELDLRNAQIADGEEVIIDTFAWWGGVEITVPENWRVVGKVLPLMGAFEDKTRATGGSGPVLIVRGTVVMGGIEVKN